MTLFVSFAITMIIPSYQKRLLKTLCAEWTVIMLAWNQNFPKSYVTSLKGCLWLCIPRLYIRAKGRLRPPRSSGAPVKTTTSSRMGLNREQTLQKTYQSLGKLPIINQSTIDRSFARALFSNCFWKRQRQPKFSHQKRQTFPWSKLEFPTKTWSNIRCSIDLQSNV